VTQAEIRVDGKLTCDCDITFRVVLFPTPDLKTYMQTEAERLQFPMEAIADG
jgi:3-hydroxyacyl-[acyl-carrier-protein] dehydratase